MLLLAGIALPSLLMSSAALANHTWGNYHWGRSANPLVLQLGDNVTSKWDTHLLQARDDWNVSDVLNTTVVAGKTNPKNCKPVTGRAEVCNSKYGKNGWLGIAQIWINGDHITQGVVKLNDTYFNTNKYNTAAWRDLVTCQEVGHIFGMGHQDENFSNPNLNTCMDYTNLPESNRHPNQHDYDLLATIYSHLDSINTSLQSVVNGAGVTRPVDVDWNNPSEWGQNVEGHVFERNLGQGRKVITDVFWIEGHKGGLAHTH
jgi:hypothetical protein